MAIEQQHEESDPVTSQVSVLPELAELKSASAETCWFLLFFAQVAADLVRDVQAELVQHAGDFWCGTPRGHRAVPEIREKAGRCCAAQRGNAQAPVVRVRLSHAQPPQQQHSIQLRHVPQRRSVRTKRLAAFDYFILT